MKAKPHTTRDLITKLVRKNPQISLQALCEATRIKRSSNVQYHLKRLEADGLIHWLGKPPAQKKSGWQVRSVLRWQNGDVVMRKMSKTELQDRIDAVVAKALKNPQAVPGEDVVQLSKSPLFQNERLRASRLG